MSTQMFAESDSPDVPCDKVSRFWRSGHYLQCPLDPSSPVGTCLKGYEAPTRSECFRCGYTLGYETAIEEIEDGFNEPDEARG